MNFPNFTQPMRACHGVHMNKYDFYDYDKAEEVREQYCRKGLDI